MDTAQTIGLCKPASMILLVSVAGILYHMLAGSPGAVVWWIMTGLFGTGIFQALCFGGLETIAWVLMAIPVLIVCFFLAVALFASSMRITNVERVPCDRCGRPKPKCGCHRPKPACGGCGQCGTCQKIADVEGFAGTSYSALGAKQAEGFVVAERFTGDGQCGCEACGCMGGPCPVCKPGGCMNCGGSGCPYCAYASGVANIPFDVDTPSALVE